MKITSKFKKTAVFVTAMLLVLIMVISVMPMASAAEATTSFDTYKITKGDADHGEKLSAINISQSGNITMLFYFTELDEIASDDYIEIKVPQQDRSIKTTQIKKSELELDDKGRTVVEVPVAAAQQTDLISLQWYKGEVAGKKREYSVKYYADKVLEYASAGNTTYIAMENNVKSLLNYGAIAQTMFDYNTDKPANYGLFTEANPIDNMLSEHMYGVLTHNNVNTEDVTFTSVQAFLQDRVQLRVYFTAPDGAVANIKKEGETVASDVHISTDSETGYKYVNLNNISSHNFDVEYTVEVTANGDTASMTYSVLEYALSTLDSNITTAAQKNTARALYLYYAWSKNYVTVKDEATPDFVPGEEGCVHGRSHVYNGAALCSDCGVDVGTKLGLTAKWDGELVSGTPTDVTFTLSIAGKVDLKSILVTLVCYDEDGNKIANALTFVEDSATYGDGSGNIQGETDRNIVLDAGTALNEACTLVTVTYTVNLAEAGIYKIIPVVHQAYNNSWAVITDDSIPSYAAIEVK